LNKIQLPVSAEEISKLRVGDLVSITGVMVTARDAAHKYLIENYVQGPTPDSEKALAEKLLPILQGGMIYHCGPVVRQDEKGKWHFVAAGPTTSIREEPYQGPVIEHFGVRGVIGKGGMGPKTLAACQKSKAVYLHAVGGAASLLADSVKEVIDVYKAEEFGQPEAFWVIRVEDFQAVVTMDSHGGSLHKDVEEKSTGALGGLIDEIKGG
jgi:fumarate hydratase subunit beta